MIRGAQRCLKEKRVATGGFEGPVRDVDATWEVCFGFPEGTAPNIRYPAR